MKKKVIKMTVVRNDGTQYNLKLPQVKTVEDIRSQLKWFENSMNCGQSCADSVVIKQGRHVVGKVINRGLCLTKLEMKPF